MTRMEEFLDRFFREHGVRATCVRGDFWIAAKHAQSTPGGFVEPSRGDRGEAVNLSELARRLEEVRA